MYIHETLVTTPSTWFDASTAGFLFPPLPASMDRRAILYASTFIEECVQSQLNSTSCLSK